MRILFISEFFPIDLRQDVVGVYKRMDMFLDALKDIGRIHMVFYVPSSIDTSPQAVAELQRALTDHWGLPLSLTLLHRFENLRRKSRLQVLTTLWLSFLKAAYSFFHQKLAVQTSGREELRAVEACLDRNPDLVFAHRLGSMSPLLLTRRPLPPLFFDMDDMEHIKFRRNTEMVGTWAAYLGYYAQVRALVRAEYRSMRLARRVFVSSDLDRDYVTRIWSIPGVVTIPNAVEIPTLEPHMLRHLFPNPGRLDRLEPQDMDTIISLTNSGIFLYMTHRSNVFALRKPEVRARYTALFEQRGWRNEVPPLRWNPAAPRAGKDCRRGEDAGFR